MTVPEPKDCAPWPILLVGDPRLRQKCNEVVEGDPDLAKEIAALSATLADFCAQNEFGRAIAAPQVGVMKRFIVIDLGEGPQPLINPLIPWHSEETFELWDDCMSLPGVLVRLDRYCAVTLNWVDPDFNRHEKTIEDPALAELVQHELDHLDGILFTDRMKGRDGIIARSTRAAAC